MLAAAATHGKDGARDLSCALTPLLDILSARDQGSDGAHLQQDAALLLWRIADDDAASRNALAASAPALAALVATVEHAPLRAASAAFSALFCLCRWMPSASFGPARAQQVLSALDAATTRFLAGPAATQAESRTEDADRDGSGDRQADAAEWSCLLRAHGAGLAALLVLSDDPQVRSNLVNEQWPAHRLLSAVLPGLGTPRVAPVPPQVQEAQAQKQQQALQPQQQPTPAPPPSMQPQQQQPQQPQQQCQLVVKTPLPPLLDASATSALADICARGLQRLFDTPQVTVPCKADLALQLCEHVACSGSDVRHLLAANAALLKLLGGLVAAAGVPAAPAAHAAAPGARPASGKSANPEAVEEDGAARAVRLTALAALATLRRLAEEERGAMLVVGSIERCGVEMNVLGVRACIRANLVCLLDCMRPPCVVVGKRGCRGVPGCNFGGLLYRGDNRVAVGRWVLNRIEIMKG